MAKLDFFCCILLISFYSLFLWGWEHLVTIPYLKAFQVLEDYTKSLMNSLFSE